MCEIYNNNNFIVKKIKYFYLIGMFTENIHDYASNCTDSQGILQRLQI